MTSKLTIDDKARSEAAHTFIRLNGAIIGYVVRGLGADGLRSGDRFWLCALPNDELIADSPLTDDIGITAVYEAHMLAR